MGFETIHETSVGIISSFIKDGIDVVRDVNGVIKNAQSDKSGVAYSSSITKASKGLVMEFPVLVSKANHIESAAIVAKAYEAKFATMLQILFSSSNITNCKEGIDYIKNFHTNLDSKMSVDEFIDIMDGFVESSDISADSYAAYKAVCEDMKNLSYYFEDDINESSLESYKVMKNYGSLKVVKESPVFYQFDADKKKQEQDKQDDMIAKSIQDTYKRTQEYLKTKEMRKNKNKDDGYDRPDAGLQDTRTSQQILSNNIVSSDLKKVNELTPTMLIINFNYKANENDPGVIKRQMIVGIKAKLYEVEPTDVINKILSKYVDSNTLLKLIKVSTREISFVKDFLLAIDDAKLDALSRSKRGSTNKLFKVLERRATGGKIRKLLKRQDYCKAISSLVISQEEAEELLKNNIDVNDPRVIRPIMEKLNLISFAIIDESSESVKFLFDTGDDVYETIPLSKLEREQRDGMSKKVIDLIAKINR